MMLIHLCKAQQELGLDVEVISIGKKSDPEKPIEKKLASEGIPHKKWRMLPLPDFRESLKIVQYYQETGTNIIHSHGYKGNILLGLLPKSRRRIPMISTVHGYTSGKKMGKMALYKMLDRYALNRMDAVVLVSEGMRHQLPGNKLKDRLHIIPNGIPLDTPENQNEPIEYFSDKDFKIGALGRLSTEKNFELLIRAMPYVLKEVPNARLVIYGEGQKRSELEGLVKHLNLQDYIFLPGYLDNSSRLYSQIDVFVNCSLSEGMPITLIEAMKQSCMMVASDIPANRALLSKVLSGRLIVKLSEDSLSDKIIEVSQMQHSQAQAAKDQAKKLFIETYTSDAMARNYRGLYHSINGSRQS
ncbi:glycosyltransferase [Marinimicrobium sp. C2-29]|uniref:glycosyltransferase n=1 Tax=Marinimicrobium sp. C2-29 TaxID=3139825 RepID=UPI003139F635